MTEELSETCRISFQK